MQARPQLNGNSVDDFAAAYVSLTDAMRAIDAARSMLSANVLHGRNYQHLSTDACIDDRRRIHAALQAAYGAIGSIASEIVDAIDAAEQ